MKCSPLASHRVELLSPVLTRAQVAEGLVGTAGVVPLDPPAHGSWALLECLRWSSRNTCPDDI